MSSSLLLRSAINTAAAAARCSRYSSFRKSSLSTLSFHPSLFSDAQCDAADVSRGAPLAVMPTMNTSYTITSYLSNMIATLSGDFALVAVEKAVKQLEEEGEWEDITTIMESPSESLSELSIWQISTLKRRKKMMNKHKLRKRRKKMRLKTRK